MVNPKHVFWQAFISAILVFGIGLLLGIYLEGSRSRAIEANLLSSEINVLDAQLMQQAGKNFNISCDLATRNAIDFANRIYSESRLLEDYDASSDLTETLQILHKRYDILRTMLWLYTIDIKKQCGQEFQTLVYIYKYEKDLPIETHSKQTAFSRMLLDLKQKYGNDIILIPIAGNLNLSSLEIIKGKYQITNYPAIILNEKFVIKDLDSLMQIEKLFSLTQSQQ